MMEASQGAAIQCYEEWRNFVINAFDDPLASLESFGNSVFEKSNHSVKQMVALLD